MLTRIRTISFAVFLLTIFSASFLPASGQTRIGDDDLARLMQNLKEDAKSFRPKFESSLKRSTIRKTSREQDAKRLAERFARQTDDAWKQFKKTKRNNVGLADIAATAQEIDKLVYDLKLGGDTVPAWSKIQQELRQVEGAFGMQPTPWASDVVSTSSVSETACRISVGEERAKRLVEECSQVSTATHPPCNAGNSCVLIIDEIKRGCSMLGRDAPEFCLEYK